MASDPSFIAAHLAPLPLNFTPRAGQDVKFKTSDGREANGFYVTPKTSHSPAIVMVHEWWGLNDYVKREAERLHDELGCGVLAVDLYDGKVASSPDQAGQLMQAAKPARSTAIVEGAVKALSTGALGQKFTRCGTIGWCFGGGWSLQSAIAGGPFVKACVMYYGMPETDLARLKMLKAPVLLVWAEQDKWINKQVVDKFKEDMSAVHRSLTVLPYDAGHGFANPSNPVYNKQDGDDAMKHSLEFFEKNLGN